MYVIDKAIVERLGVRNVSEFGTCVLGVLYSLFGDDLFRVFALPSVREAAWNSQVLIRIVVPKNDVLRDKQTGIGAMFAQCEVYNIALNVIVEAHSDGVMVLTFDNRENGRGYNLWDSREEKHLG